MTLDVRVGGTPATALEVISDTQLRCRVPKGSAGHADVTVSTGGGQATLVKGFRYEAARIVKVRPDKGWAGQPVEVDYEGVDPAAVYAVAVGGQQLSGLDKTRPGVLLGHIAENAAIGVSDVHIVYLSPDRPDTIAKAAFTVLPKRGIVRVQPNEGRQDPFREIVIHTVGIEWRHKEPGYQPCHLVEICGARTSTITRGQDQIVTVFKDDFGGGKVLPGWGDVVLYADAKGTQEIVRLVKGFNNTGP